MINTIIYTQIYPQVLKISKITPTLKQDKLINLIDSFRPINNLSCIDKIIEQYLKDCLIDFFNDNDIIINDHHGSRKYHSNITVLAAIKHNLITQYDSNNISAIIQTDLSAAFDTVDY